MSRADDIVRAAGVPELPEGARLLNEVHATLRQYVVFAQPEYVDAVTLYVAATHAQPAWEHATRLVVKSPIKRCGKTRLQEIIAGLGYRVIRTINISSAALVRSIDKDDPPTLMLDEADSVFATRRGERSEKAEDLRGIINSGHSRGWPYIRWDPTTRSREVCPTFAMVVIGGIGDFPDTIEDRAVIVPMRRKMTGEQVTQYRSKRVVPRLRALNDRLHSWVREQVDLLGDADPDLPVEDRAADTWEPLVAIADAAGGDWPERARKACMIMTGAVEADEADLGQQLLADLLTVFDQQPRTLDQQVAPHLMTAVILRDLNNLDESPWADIDGKRLDARGLAKLLRPYGVKSHNVRTGDHQAKGYLRSDFEDAWARYIRPKRPNVPDQSSLQANHGTDGGTDGGAVSVPDSGTDGGTDVSGTIRPASGLQEYDSGDVGTHGTHERGGDATEDDADQDTST